ncbi:MAG: TolB family protein, partial [Actinomycetota bacterium]
MSWSHDSSRSGRGLWALAALSITALLASTLASTDTAKAAFPGGNGKIAFESARDGNLEIYSMAPDGTGQVNLTNDPASDTDPVWSPDGTRIAFVRAADIWVMNADGTGQQNLTPAANDGQGNVGINPTWSPDGQRIAYQDSHEIWAMNAGDGGGKTNLTNTPGNQPGESLPAWSPDGTKIAYIRDFDIWVMNPDGSGDTQLTFTSGADASERWSDWSPDGDRIVYDRSGQAWVMNADGTGQEALTGGTNESGEQPAFSPDGTKIVFHSNAFDAPNGDDI